MQLNRRGRRAVDQTLAVFETIRKETGLSDEACAQLTLAAATMTAGGCHVVHDPDDPMSTAA